MIERLSGSKARFSLQGARKFFQRVKTSLLLMYLKTLSQTSFSECRTTKLAQYIRKLNRILLVPNCVFSTQLVVYYQVRYWITGANKSKLFYFMRLLRLTSCMYLQYTIQDAASCAFIFGSYRIQPFTYPVPWFYRKLKVINYKWETLMLASYLYRKFIATYHFPNG